MPIGKSVRHALGRFEPTAIRVYRNRFIDVESLAVTIASVVPNAKRVLEVGCGDGAVAAALRRSLPSCEFLGLDPGLAAPGALYDGDPAGVTFRRATTTELLAEKPDPYDLVIVCDVIHHVAEEERQQVLLDAAALTAPGGTVALKEWERIRGLGYYPGYYADRYVSGDATVRFMPRPELQQLVDTATPGWATTCEARIPPRRANLLLTRQRPAA
jgi:SAM-dependent methyltransferase